MKPAPGATETIKWNFPHFEYGGAILCNMAAFKKHCTFGFWKAALMSDPKGILEAIGKTAMGQLGQITARKSITWVTEAKTELTREKRLTQAIEWMAEGKIRNWKYVR